MKDRPEKDAGETRQTLLPYTNVPAPEPDLAPRVFGVSALVRAARLLLETSFDDVRVEGEISGARLSGPGHLYFTLKDADAQLDCVLFARELARLKFRPDDGLQVRCRGRLTIFEGRGRFQLAVADMQPAGAGALALAFEQLKQRLAAEGLFEESRKRPLPYLPRRIGVVTSPTGAVIRDIVNVAHRRFPVAILLAPTPVQGEGAAAQIVLALERIARAPAIDVIIVARGGGSIEDLWAFNEESVARAIARCPVPVISAVGHETDFTIADFVADRRAPTPSAAAELAVPDMRVLRETLRTTGRGLEHATDLRLQRARRVLDRLRAGFEDPRRLLQRKQQDLDDLGRRADRALRKQLAQRRQILLTTIGRLDAAHPRQRILAHRRELDGLGARLRAGIDRTLAPRRRSVTQLSAKLDALSPLRVLERGYSVTRAPDGRVVRRATDVRAGDPIHVIVYEGSFAAVVAGADSDKGGGS